MAGSGTNSDVNEESSKDSINVDSDKSSKSDSDIGSGEGGDFVDGSGSETHLNPV